jgi:hypothetical protein
MCLLVVLWLSSDQRCLSQTKPPAADQQIVVPFNCESNSATVDAVHNAAGKDGLIIVVARLGDGEQNRNLNRLRLTTVAKYFTNEWRRDAKTVVLAEGERIRGFGRVEFYVNGKLTVVLAAKRRQPLRLTNCAA